MKALRCGVETLNVVLSQSIPGLRSDAAGLFVSWNCTAFFYDHVASYAPAVHAASLPLARPGTEHARVDAVRIAALIAALAAAAVFACLRRPVRERRRLRQAKQGVQESNGHQEAGSGEPMSSDRAAGTSPRHHLSLASCSAKAVMT